MSAVSFLALKSCAPMSKLPPAVSEVIPSTVPPSTSIEVNAPFEALTTEPVTFVALILVTDNVSPENVKSESSDNKPLLP